MVGDYSYDENMGLKFQQMWMKTTNHGWMKGCGYTTIGMGQNFIITQHIVKTFWGIH